ncbi:hypothetical protein [Desulfonatronum parangueonense]
MTDLERLAARSHSGESRNPVQVNDQALDVLNRYGSRNLLVIKMHSRIYLSPDPMRSSPVMMCREFFATCAKFKFWIQKSLSSADANTDDAYFWDFAAEATESDASH